MARPAARQIDKPEPGYFEMREVKGGALVPACIFIPCPFLLPSPDVHPDDWFSVQDRSWCYRHQALIANKPADPFRVWLWATPVSEERYLYLVAVLEWARQNRPDLPEANPRQQVDLRNSAPVF